MVKHIILALVLTVSFSCPVIAQNNAWLIGVWQLTDEDKVEKLEFAENKIVILISSRGIKLEGDYELLNGSIKIVYKFKGKKIPVELSYAAGKNILIGNLANTGKSVKYKKAG